jgi:hypothetical protein
MKTISSLYETAASVFGVYFLYRAVYFGRPLKTFQRDFPPFKGTIRDVTPCILVDGYQCCR